jgi:chromosome segregation ATPase
MTEQSEQLDAIISRFTDSENALRRLMESAQQMESAEAQLSGARAELKVSHAESIQSLEAARAHIAATHDSAERSFGDASSGIYALTLELKDISRDLKDMAIAWRSIGPEGVRNSLDELSTSVQRRENQMRIWLSILTVLVLALGGLAIFT